MKLILNINIRSINYNLFQRSCVLINPPDRKYFCVLEIERRSNTATKKYELFNNE